MMMVMMMGGQRARPLLLLPRRFLLLLALCMGLLLGGVGGMDCEGGGEAVCSHESGYVCRDLAHGYGFECVGLSSPCPDMDSMGAHVPEHARVLFSPAPGRPFTEQRTYSVSVVNGTAPQINKPRAQIVCEEGYAGIPQTAQYQVVLQCSCTPGLFGVAVCQWNNFNEALAQVIEAAGRDSRPQEWRACRKAGCTDRTAKNYDSSALKDDGSCIAKLPGCMDPSARNYMWYFNVNDSASCRYEVDLDECDSSPCVHGSCRDNFHSYHCNCETGWSGERCDSHGASPPPPANQCPPGQYMRNEKCNVCTVCPNGKAEHTPCSPTSDTYCEACPSGRFNDGSWAEGGCHDCSACCRGWVLQRGGVCRPDRDTQCAECPHEQYAGTPGQCLDCGSCANAQDVCMHSVQATCSKGTEISPHGPACQAKSHCLNGGAPTSEVGCGAMQGIQLFGQVIECQCSCPSGWVGKHCEQASPCNDSPCNNGTCYERDSALVADGEQPYSCRCLPGYSGSRCQLHTPSCGPCCNGVKNCTNGTSTVCSDEAPPAQCGTTRSQCDPPCANGGNCVDLGFEGLTDCGCVFPWGGDDCTKRSNYTLAHDGGTSPGSALDVVNKIRDETGVNSSDQMIYILATILVVSSCGALSACVLGFRRHRAKLHEARQEIEMRMVPQGPTGLGHLRQGGHGSIKDLSQLPEYKPEPGFEDFDYNPHEEGAGDDYFAALSGKSEGSGGRKMEMFSGRFGSRRSLLGGKEGSQKGGLTESLVG